MSHLSESAWSRGATGFWTLLLVAVTVKILVQGDEHTVYPIYVAASRHWFSGESLYHAYPGLDLFRYSPTFAVAMTPFSLLPSRLGNILWTAGGVLMLAYATRQFARRFLCPWSARAEGVMSILVAAASIRMVWNGQSNTLLVALVLLALVAFQRGQWLRAAAMMTAPVFIKVWPVALLMLMVASWPRQLLPRVLPCLLVFLLIPFVTAPPSIVIEQYQHWYLSLVTDQGRWPGFRDLWMIWDTLWPPVNARLYLGLQLGGALATLWYTLAFRQDDRRQGEKLFVIMAAWLCWQLLLGPASERATYGILGPCLAFGIVNYRGQRVGLLVLAWLVLVVFGLGDLERAVASIIRHAEIALPLSPLLLAVWLVWLGYTRRAGGAVS